MINLDEYQITKIPVKIGLTTVLIRRPSTEQFLWISEITKDMGADAIDDLRLMKLVLLALVTNP